MLKKLLISAGILSGAIVLSSTVFANLYPGYHVGLENMLSPDNGVDVYYQVGHYDHGSLMLTGERQQLNTEQHEYDVTTVDVPGNDYYNNIIHLTEVNHHNGGTESYITLDVDPIPAHMAGYFHFNEQMLIERTGDSSGSNSCVFGGVFNPITDQFTNGMVASPGYGLSRSYYDNPTDSSEVTAVLINCSELTANDPQTSPCSTSKAKATSKI